LRRACKSFEGMVTSKVRLKPSAFFSVTFIARP
jgi:hypothetical protein